MIKLRLFMCPCSRRKTAWAINTRLGRHTVHGVYPNTDGDCRSPVSNVTFIFVTQEIRDLLTSWSDELFRCSRIFLRAPGHNRAALFAGKKPLFSKSDPRLSIISIETRRPTFRELQRVHAVLATIHVYGLTSLHFYCYYVRVVRMRNGYYSPRSKDV